MSDRGPELPFDAERPADFFMSSGEYLVWSEPRSCWLLGAVEGPEADREYALLGLSPPVLGQAVGRGGDDVFTLIVTPRSSGDRLPLGRRLRLAVDVHVLVPFGELDFDRPFSLGEVEHAAWATLLRTREEAVAMHEAQLRADRFTA